MRFLVLGLLCLAGCGKADPPAPSATPTQPPMETGGDVRSTDPAGRIAFVKNSRALWTMNGDGSDAREIVKGDLALMGHPAWSPNRTWIAFSWATAPERNLYRRNLFLVKPDGSGLRQVTPIPHSGDLMPGGPRAKVTGRAVVALPNGRLGVEGFDVAVYGVAGSVKSGKSGRFEIMVPATTAWVKLSGQYEGLSFSGSTMRPFTMNDATDLGDVLLTPGGADEEAIHPAWSGDGRHLYFILLSMGRTSIARIGIEGTGCEVRYSDGTKFEGPLAWEGIGLVAWDRKSALKFDPEARSITFRSDRGFAVPGVGAVHRLDVAQVAMDEKLRQTIKSKAFELTLEPSAGTIRALDFSPDGKSLVIEIRTSDGKNDLHILDTEKARPLTTDGASGDPAWYGR